MVKTYQKYVDLARNSAFYVSTGMNLHVDCKEVMLQFYSTETCKFDAYLASVGIQSEQLESDSD